MCIFFAISYKNIGYDLTGGEWEEGVTLKLFNEKKNHELLILIDAICIFFMFLSAAITNTFWEQIVLFIYFLCVFAVFREGKRRNRGDPVKKPSKFQFICSWSMNKPENLII